MITDGDSPVTNRSNGRKLQKRLNKGEISAEKNKGHLMSTANKSIKLMVELVVSNSSAMFTNWTLQPL